MECRVCGVKSVWSVECVEVRGCGGEVWSVKCKVLGVECEM